MLQVFDSQQQTAPYDDTSGPPIWARYLGAVKRRFLYLLVPFVLISLVGSFVVMVQRPVYSSEGKILIESQDIPTELVRPTVTTAATERLQVIQQRMTTRDNLVAIMNKYGLFPAQRKWMSASQLLDLMKERTQIRLLDLTGTLSLPSRANNLTVAFTVGFEYENADLAMQVANEFVTSILAEDARDRTNRAVETTKFLSREVKRLEAELGASEAMVAEIRRRPRDTSFLSGSVAAADPNIVQLAALRADLIQKSTVYSQSHPELKVLKQRIAALEEVVAAKPPEPTKPAQNTLVSAAADGDLEPLLRQTLGIERELEEATRKLSAARLGESLERDQQSERLQVIEQPSRPQKPSKPNRMRLFAMVFGLAAAVGGGAVLALESFDRSIRTRDELFRVIDSNMIVAIPYIFTAAERRRKRAKLYYAVGGAVAVLIVGVAGFLFLGPPVEVMLAGLSQFDFSWLEALTHLTK